MEYVDPRRPSGAMGGHAMAEQRRDMPHTGGEKPDNNQRTNWKRILLPLITIGFLAVFIFAMLIIYALAD